MKYYEILDRVSCNFRLDINGIHGLKHWQRVWENGQRVAEEIHKTNPGAVDLEVVELFAWLHDSERDNDDGDYFHGQRAVNLLDRMIRKKQLVITESQRNTLITALAFHSDGLMDNSSNERTIQTCWDADRLDLTRCGITPDPRLLSKEAASLLVKV